MGTVWNPTRQSSSLGSTSEELAEKYASAKEELEALRGSLAKEKATADSNAAEAATLQEQVHEKVAALNELTTKYQSGQHELATLATALTKSKTDAEDAVSAIERALQERAESLSAVSTEAATLREQVTLLQKAVDMIRVGTLAIEMEAKVEMDKSWTAVFPNAKDSNPQNGTMNRLLPMQ